MSSLDHVSIQDFVSFQLQKALDRDSILAENGGKETLKTLSTKLGLKSPSLLSMIANGKRLPSEKFLETLFDHWKISAKERKLLRLQLQLEKKHQKGKDALALMQEIKKLNPPSAFYKLKLNEIESIRDWYVLAVRALANSPEFQDDPHWISQKLRQKISPKQAQKAVTLLVERGLLVRTPEGRVRVCQDAVEATNNIPSESIRQHHRGMLHRALEALSEQTVEERLFNSLTLNFEPTDMDAATKKIADFVKVFHEEFGKNTSDSVYQLNVQFFSHTSTKKGRKR